MTPPSIKQLINNLEPELRDGHNVDALAKRCYTSAMQLQRDFYNVTGYSVNNYIRHLRLSNALCMIKASQFSLADIAYACGYSSQQALCREVKAILGTTATAYKEANDYYFLSALSDDVPFQIEVSKITVPKTLCLAHYNPVLRGIENNAVNLFLRNNPGYSGRIFGRNGAQKGNMLCYELHVEATESIDPEPLNTHGFQKTHHLPAYEAICAQTRVKNNEDDINAAWDYLYSAWLPGSMFEYAGQTNKGFEHQYFEEYFYRNNISKRLKLYLPIIRRRECLKISVETVSFMRFFVFSREGHNAERDASKAVIEYLSRYHPYIAANAQEFYLEQDGERFTCGVKINTDLTVNEPDFQMLHFDNQTFAVLYFNGISDFGRSKQMLLNWLYANNLSPTGTTFAVYDAATSFETPRMRIYCPILSPRA